MNSTEQPAVAGPVEPTVRRQQPECEKVSWWDLQKAIERRDGLPVIPGLPEPMPKPPDGAVAICGVCGLRILPVMGYVCGNPRCGVFPRVTCAT